MSLKSWKKQRPRKRGRRKSRRRGIGAEWTPPAPTGDANEILDVREVAWLLGLSISRAYGLFRDECPECRGRCVGLDGLGCKRCGATGLRLPNKRGTNGKLYTKRGWLVYVGAESRKSGHSKARILAGKRSYP